jgi:hypothetical protein
MQDYSEDKYRKHGNIFNCIKTYKGVFRMRLCVHVFLKKDDKPLFMYRLRADECTIIYPLQPQIIHTILMKNVMVIKPFKHLVKMIHMTTLYYQLFNYSYYILGLCTVHSESDEQNLILESAKCKSARCNKMIKRPIECAECKTLVWSYNMKKHYKISNPEIQTCPH